MAIEDTVMTVYQVSIELGVSVGRVHQLIKPPDNSPGEFPNAWKAGIWIIPRDDFDAYKARKNKGEVNEDDNE
jgi:hypothetical protein